MAKWQKFECLNPNPAHKRPWVIFNISPMPQNQITNTLHKHSKYNISPKFFYISTTTEKYWMLYVLFDGYFGDKIRLYKKHKNSLDLLLSNIEPLIRQIEVIAIKYNFNFSYFVSVLLFYFYFIINLFLFLPFFLLPLSSSSFYLMQWPLIKIRGCGHKNLSISPFFFLFVWWWGAVTKEYSAMCLSFIF